MLVLTRRQNESIIIANNIKITVVSVGPGRVKLGIEAPPNVRVDRKEIHDKIEQSTDVLAAVGGETMDGHHNTVVGHSGPDTTLIVASAPAEAPQAASDTNARASETGSPALSGINKYRLPRKPR